MEKLNYTNLAYWIGILGLVCLCVYLLVDTHIIKVIARSITTMSSLILLVYFIITVVLKPTRKE